MGMALWRRQRQRKAVEVKEHKAGSGGIPMSDDLRLAIYKDQKPGQFLTDPQHRRYWKKHRGYAAKMARRAAVKA